MDPYKGEVEIDGRPIEWQTSFDRSVRFSCQECAYCCFATNVILFPRDVERISHVAQDFKEDYHGFVRIKGTDRAYCPFLKDKSCTIYPVRPSLCREYPFKVSFVSDNKAYIDVVSSCPSILEKRYAKTNIVDFDALVSASARNVEVDFGILSVMPDSRRRMQSIWADLAHDLTKKYPLEIIDNPDFFSFFFPIVLRTIHKEHPYLVWDVKNHGFFRIDADPGSLIIDDGSKKIRVQQGELKALGFGKEGHHATIAYFQHLLDRQTTLMDLACGHAFLRSQGKEVAVECVVQEFFRRSLMVFQFFLSVVAVKNGSKKFTERDVRETIFAVDITFLSPMESMLGAFAGAQ